MNESAGVYQRTRIAKGLMVGLLDGGAQNAR